MRDEEERRTKKARSEALVERLKAKRGYLLPFHRLLAAHAPGTLEKYDDFYSQVWFERNVLDPRVKELIAVGIHTAILEREGLEIRMKRAMKAGATEAEIVEAVTLAGIPAGMYTVLVGSHVWDRITKEKGFTWEAEEKRAR
ncbi:MAG: carboxymuconolactone decarboxylase family protein [Chloroflexota bacterium]|nr:carboxymuconolactone decarboxylase family protein [Chloroflexota bacterium]